MLEAEIQRFTLEGEESLRIQKRLEEEKEELKKFLDSYESEKEKRNKLIQIYRAGDGESLSELIDVRLRKVILDSELKRREVLRLEKQLENLRQGSPAVMSPAAEKVVEYIRRCHGFKCVFGGDYLKDVSDYDRKILLERIPFLPEAIIVESGLSKIKEDRVLSEMDLGDGLVPIISLAQVMRQEEVIAGPEIIFLSKNPEWYMNAASRQEALERLEKALKEAQTALVRLGDREQTMSADRKYMDGFELNFQQYYPRRIERWNGIRGELDELQQKIRENGEMLESCQKRRTETEQRLKTTASENDALDQDIDILEQMNGVEEQLTEIQERKRQLEASMDKNRDQQKQAEEKLNRAKETMGQLEAQKKALREEIGRMETRWHELYESYYLPGEPGENDLSSEAIDARFKGLKDTYEKEHMDLEDKKQLLESYQQMMDTALYMIQRRDIDASMLEDMFKEHRLAPVEACLLYTSDAADE